MLIAVSLQPCSHCSSKSANEYEWANPAIVVAADHASSALYNFIIPLRAHYRPIHELNPIVLLLEQMSGLETYCLQSMSHSSDPTTLFSTQSLRFLTCIGCAEEYQSKRMVEKQNCNESGERFHFFFSLNNLLRSGICQADHLVLVKEGFASDEEHLADCNTIVTVQTIHRYIITLFCQKFDRQAILLDT